MPTLIYNCAKMPAICTNLNRRNPLTPRPGGGLGQLVGGPITLHFDTDTKRRDRRRAFACPSSWKRNHACPETNPAQPKTVPAGASLDDGAYAARPYAPARQNKRMGDAGWNTIENDRGLNSGMVSW